MRQLLVNKQERIEGCQFVGKLESNEVELVLDGFRWLNQLNQSTQSFLLLLFLSEIVLSLITADYIAILKYVQKLQTHFVRSLNNFDTSHLLDGISLVMDSDGCVDNFQPVSVTKPAYFGAQKQARKFDDFRKKRFSL